MCDSYKNYKMPIKENYFLRPAYVTCPSCFDYYPLGKLPSPAAQLGASFGRRTMRDVMEWKQTMGNAPYPWGPDGNHYVYVPPGY